MKTSTFFIAAFSCVLLAVLQWPTCDGFGDDAYLYNEDLDLGEREVEEFQLPVSEINVHRSIANEKRSILGLVVGGWVLGKLGRKRRSVDVVEPSDSDVALKDLAAEVIEVEENVERTFQEATPKDLDQLTPQRVIKAEKYELPVLTISDWFKRKHDGVVVTLASGRRLLILKGYEFFREKSATVLDARAMSDAWRLVDRKEPIEKATLGDYILASERSYNSVHAAAKMMALN